MKSRYASFLFFLFLLAFSCGNAQKPTATIKLGADARLLLLSKTDAAAAITQDATDGFFDKVTACEMSIQMKKPLAKGQIADDKMRREYVAFLKNDVEDFSADEAKMVAEVMAEVHAACQKVAPGIFPAELKMIKTTGTHYGDGVYYTRENCIVIPKNELESRDHAGFLSTMYHELFHVYSRLHPVARKALYGLIGFESIGYQQLAMPESLSSRVFFNPDGVDFAQKITLQTADGKMIDAVPVIYSNHLGHKPGQPEFFSYLEFNLFQIKPEGTSWRVVTAADGFSSTLDLKNLPDFFKQIKDNTQYIIHPDEVLADNFSFVMRGKSDPAANAKFSEAGKQLLLDVEKILKEASSSVQNSRADGSNGSNRR